jgi:hypothetical protein
MEWTASRPGRFTPEEVAPGRNRIGDWVGPTPCLDLVERKMHAPAGYDGYVCFV